jgi:fructose-bisphosphate aldolase class II
MHGSSSVPEDLQSMINNYGGDIRPTWGVPVEEIQRGIRSGVRKVNIDTDNRLAMTAAIRKALAEDPAEFDPRKYLKPAMMMITEVCKARFEAFGTAGQASRLRPVPLEAMAKSYSTRKSTR